MSVHSKVRRITVPDITNRKGGDPIMSLTSSHARMAAIVGEYADIILVGDSLGMVTHWIDDTVGVTVNR